MSVRRKWYIGIALTGLYVGSLPLTAHMHWKLLGEVILLGPVFVVVGMALVFGVWGAMRNDEPLTANVYLPRNAVAITNVDEIADAVIARMQGPNEPWPGEDAEADTAEYTPPMNRAERRRWARQKRPVTP